MLEVITDPVESRSETSIYRRNQKSADEKLANLVGPPGEYPAIQAKAEEERNNLDVADQRGAEKLLGVPED